MRVSVNGVPREVEEDLTVEALLERLGMTGKPVAVAVNARVVPRGERAGRRLSEDDAVEIIEAVGGG